MALSRRTGQRFQGSVWPGFVDAMTGLLMVLTFVLTIFMVVQFVLRETISGQESELDALSSEVAALAQALGVKEAEADRLQTRLGELDATLGVTRGELSQAQGLIASLSAQRDRQEAALAEASGKITAFEAQVAALLAERNEARTEIAGLQQDRAELEARRDALLSEQEALNLALARSRDEIDAQVEAARLAAARREALEALVADLRQDVRTQSEASAALETRLSEEEAARLAEAAAAEALRQKLLSADAELTAMTLALDAQRRQAEETLTLLAAADAAQEALKSELEQALADIDAARAQAQDRDALAERLARVLAQLETVQSEATDRAAALEAEIADARTEARDSEAARAEAEARLLAALEDLERSEALATDTEVLQRRLLAALADRDAARDQIDAQRNLADDRAALLAQAQLALDREKDVSTEAQRQMALLNQQVAELRSQLGGLQALLDDYKDRDAAAQVQLQSLGQDLNAALARAASEERRRRLLEEAEAERLAAEAQALQEEAKLLEAQARDLERYRSEFFGRLRDVLGDQDGVRIEGDRFVFSSEVLFALGSADLSAEGRREITKVAQILTAVAEDIPPELGWIIRVDGHTDDTPLLPGARFADNWELSQARALSVVRYMVQALGIPPNRLAANGFGEFQPVNPADTPAARAQNRRIELKLTER